MESSWTSTGYVYYPVIEAANEHIACEPFKNDLTETVNKGTGFNTMKGLTTLTPLKVIFGNRDYPAGQTIYVRADLGKNQDARMQYDVEGQKVIFIPVKDIKLVKRFDPVSWGLNVPQSEAAAK
jgi:hypothetical protein